MADRANRGLEASAITIHGEARKRTPVDTGRMRASLAWAVGASPKHHSDTEQGVTVSYTLQARPKTAVVGTNVEYAPFVHENLNAYHETGQAKFLESAARDSRMGVERVMRLALKGLL